MKGRSLLRNVLDAGAVITALVFIGSYFPAWMLCAAVGIVAAVRSLLPSAGSAAPVPTG